jgi:hypothetical protein
VFDSMPLLQVELVEIGGRRSRIIYGEITPCFPFVRKPRRPMSAPLTDQLGARPSFQRQKDVARVQSVPG